MTDLNRGSLALAGQVRGKGGVRGRGRHTADSDSRGGPTDREADKTGSSFNAFPVSDEVHGSRAKKRQLQHVGE